MRKSTCRKAPSRGSFHSTLRGAIGAPVLFELSSSLCCRSLATFRIADRSKALCEMRIRGELLTKVRSPSAHPVPNHIAKMYTTPPLRYATIQPLTIVHIAFLSFLCHIFSALMLIPTKAEVRKVAHLQLGPDARPRRGRGRAH